MARQGENKDFNGHGHGHKCLCKEKYYLPIAWRIEMTHGCSHASHCHCPAVWKDLKLPPVFAIYNVTDQGRVYKAFVPAYLLHCRLKMAT